MEAFREGLRLRGLPDLRSSVLDDLSVYFKLDAEEALYGATHSFERAVSEWNAQERRSPEEIRDFYLHQQSWAFGQLWYAYLQAEGYAAPVATMIACDMTDRPRVDLLDFGSGVGAGAMMFRQLGHAVSLADVSPPLLDFARFRFERRGLVASFVDLNTEVLGAQVYDTVTAIQTLAHVPNVGATAAGLHRTLRPGGLLYADIDVQQRQAGDSRLYDDDLPLRRILRGTGFVEDRSLEGVSVRYRRVRSAGLAHECQKLRDAFVLGPSRRYWRQIRYR